MSVVDTKTVAQILRPKPIVLDVSKGIRREPVRPAEFQILNFAEKFDDSTLFFDTFFDHAGKHVVFVGPAYFNLQPYIEKMTVSALPSGKQCALRIKNMDRHAQVWATVPDQTTRVVIESGFGRFEVSPNRNISHLFENKRVLWTLSKNNRLEWITDWVRYNRDIHGANAVLIYDNVSTIYTLQELQNALASIAGIETVCVVDWPFKYGPQGLDAWRFWDSDFCAHGSYEHARWAALQCARSVLNSDIDELVISEDNSSVFEAAERSWTGTVRYQGVWVYGLDKKTDQQGKQAAPSFTDFNYYLRPRVRKKFGIVPVLDDACPTKWAVVPSRCPENALWTSHRIKNWISAIPVTRKFCYRHFRDITTNWKYERSAALEFPLDRFQYDNFAVSAYARVDWTA